MRMHILKNASPRTQTGQWQLVGMGQVVWDVEEVVVWAAKEPVEHMHGMKTRNFQRLMTCLARKRPDVRVVWWLQHLDGRHVRLVGPSSSFF